MCTTKILNLLVFFLYIPFGVVQMMKTPEKYIETTRNSLTLSDSGQGPHWIEKVMKTDESVLCCRQWISNSTHQFYLYKLEVTLIFSRLQWPQAFLDAHCSAKDTRVYQGYVTKDPQCQLTSCCAYTLICRPGPVDSPNRSFNITDMGSEYYICWRYSLQLFGYLTSSKLNKYGSENKYRMIEGKQNLWQMSLTPQCAMHNKCKATRLLCVHILPHPFETLQ